MQKLVQVFGALAVVAACGAPALAQQAGRDYLPLQRGNRWTYQSQGPLMAQPPFTVGVDDVYGSWFHHTGMLGKGRWLAYYGDGVVVWNGATGRSEWLYKFGQPAGTSWRLNLGDCFVGTLTIGARDTRVATPAGTFDNCVRIDWTNQTCSHGYVRTEWFAPGVGLVKQQVAGTGPADSENTLTAATVGGVSYPRPAGNGRGVTVTLALDDSDYLHQPNTIRCITTPCPSNERIARAKVSFVVKNDGVRNVPYTRGGQPYDIVIRNDQGNDVWRWSDGKAFTRELRLLVLQPGQSVVVNEEVELRARDGRPLVGDYTIEVYIPTNRGWRATASFSAAWATP